MSLETLPDDILIFIFKQLDIRSLESVYLTCARFRTITSAYGLVKTCDLALSVMAKAETLKSPFFRDVSRNIQVLNLCGVCNLNKTVLLPAIKKLKLLNTLDVTYTNITLTDFIDLYYVCPSIRDISINFDFGKLKRKIQISSFLPYQEVFENIVNVHFVGHFMVLLRSKSPALLLKKAKLNKLQYTVIDCDVDDMHSYNDLNDDDDGIPIIFDTFVSKMSHTKIPLTPKHTMSHPLPLWEGCIPTLQRYPFNPIEDCIQIFGRHPIDLDKYEAISLISPTLFMATAKFESFFNKCSELHPKIRFKINTDKHCFLKCLYNPLFGWYNVFVMLWNKSKTNFDDKFFADLWCTLKPYFTYFFHSKLSTPIQNDYNLFVARPNTAEGKDFNRRYYNRLRLIRTAEIAEASTILNFDTVFKEQNTVKLSILFDIGILKGVGLSADYDYLKKLTFLSLSGQMQYNDNFFDLLFRCCKNLATLSVKAGYLFNCSAAIAQSLPLSQSVKNILVIDRDICFYLMFSSMSQCKTLENVHIFDTAETINFSDPSIVFQNCLNLYCMHLYICSSVSSKEKYIDIIKMLPSEKETFIKILSNKYVICDPYSDVFNIHYL